MPAQPMHLGDGVVQVLDDHALGDFQLDHLRRQARLLERREDAFDEFALVELTRADVDAQAEPVGPHQAGRQQRSRHAAGLAYHPVAHSDDQPAFFQHLHEVGRRAQALFWMPPAQQRLGSDDHPRSGVDLRLQKEFEFAMRQCQAQFALQLQANAGGLLHGATEKLGGVAA